MLIASSQPNQFWFKWSTHVECRHISLSHCVPAFCSAIFCICKSMVHMLYAKNPLTLGHSVGSHYIIYIHLRSLIRHNVMVHLVCLIRMPPTISNHLRLCPPTLQCHSGAHCISSHNHATPVAGLNSDQCLISPDFVPMSRATTYLSFSPYAAFA